MLFYHTLIAFAKPASASFHTHLPVTSNATEFTLIFAHRNLSYRLGNPLGRSHLVVATIRRSRGTINQRFHHLGP